ncbi:MAG: ribosome small subunit-dependent GTPase A [Clostridium argentinense]|uniref:Small ribosomal subunit biogenesis GTPase RsgA n=1 Tax=Clostridium faecium TaxID=2762223 RepID=A0ABR8YPE5_9CLOT|nr:ribosome small subunit-dependent GTPase A [Clostridium faecium]MBD8046126.1 ribosome small subunit-dependent GTPase A [Clostridium faecium]MBS5824046.1 ribosome small subunit-dependent GTPase A [Clostridium argentinense]MDU1347694.1 ribosome small subunit-dependent GTPase A [Clostridium argentinense]
MGGVIVKGIGGLYYVNVNGEIYKCKARGKFRYNNLTPMIGDNVEISIEKDSASIEKIYERKTELIRPAVANVTQAFVVFAFKHPDLNKDLLNKFLLLCEYNGLKAVVCFNKMDLVYEDKSSIKDELESAGYEVLYLEAKNNKGLDQLREKIKGNISVFCGPSGVGKSTILNNFIGREVMQTGEISDKLKRGKHTTRHSELIELEDGFLVDTPGFSSLELDFINKEQLQYCFKEFDEYRDECKFNNCVHYKEPKCGVKNAVERGKIHKSRYEFYIKTLEEIISRGNRK